MCSTNNYAKNTGIQENGRFNKDYAVTQFPVYKSCSAVWMESIKKFVCDTWWALFRSRLFRHNFQSSLEKNKPRGKIVTWLKKESCVIATETEYLRLVEFGITISLELRSRLWLVQVATGDQCLLAVAILSLNASSSSGNFAGLVVPYQFFRVCQNSDEPVFYQPTVNNDYEFHALVLCDSRNPGTLP